jgi:hypothetical protein
MRTPNPFGGSRLRTTADSVTRTPYNKSQVQNATGFGRKGAPQIKKNKLSSYELFVQIFVQSLAIFINTAFATAFSKMDDQA